MIVVAYSIPTTALTHLLQVIQLESKTPVGFAVSHKRSGVEAGNNVQTNIFLGNRPTWTVQYDIITRSIPAIHLIRLVYLVCIACVLKYKSLAVKSNPTHFGSARSPTVENVLYIYKQARS